MSDDADEREAEFSTLEAIYTDQLIPTSEFAGHLELPIALSSPLKVETQNEDEQNDHQRQALVMEHLLSICIDFTLPDGYPDILPPQISIHTTHGWLRKEKLKNLGSSLCEDYGHAQVTHSFITQIEELAESAFGITSLEVSHDLFAHLQACSLKAKKSKFEKDTYTCGICLDPKKGSVCHDLEHCSHVFYIECLQAHYNNAILLGNVNKVRCPEVIYGLENTNALERRIAKPRLITPSVG